MLAKRGHSQASGAFRKPAGPFASPRGLCCLPAPSIRARCGNSRSSAMISVSQMQQALRSPGARGANPCENSALQRHSPTTRAVDPKERAEQGKGARLHKLSKRWRNKQSKPANARKLCTSARGPSVGQSAGPSQTRPPRRPGSLRCLLAPSTRARCENTRSSAMISVRQCRASVRSRCARGLQTSAAIAKRAW